MEITQSEQQAKRQVKKKKKKRTQQEEGTESAKALRSRHVWYVRRTEERQY